MIEGVARVGDVDLRWELGGDGPVVLLISGTGGDLRAPDLVRPALRRRLRVLAYDQRNLGRSTIRDAPTTMAAYADDAAGLVDALAEQLPEVSAPLPVVGISFGGMVAQELALRHRGLVTRLALVCTSPGGEGGSSFPLHTLEPLDDRRAEAVRTLELADVRLDASWRAAHPERLRSIVGDLVARGSVGAGEPGREVGARRQLEARSVHDTWDRLDQLDVPVLVQGGRHDGIALPEVAQRLADRLPGAALRMYDGGHAFLSTSHGAQDDLADFLVGGR